VTVGQQGGTLTQVLSVDTTSLSGMVRINLGARGAVSVDFIGISMGIAGWTGGARGGHTGCESTDWVSGTAVRCRIGQSEKGSRTAAVTHSGQQVGTITRAWSVDLPDVRGIMGINHGSQAPSAMTLYGKNMGTAGDTGRSREGSTGCEGTEWGSETSIKCLTGATLEGTRTVVITTGEQKGSLTQTWSTDSTRTMNLTRGIIYDYAIIYLHGSGMGVVGYTGRAREGYTACERTTWISETSMRCRVHGSREGLRVVLTVGQQGGTLMQVLSVDAASVSGMVRINLGARGAVSVDFIGISMGIAGWTGGARGGHTGCESTDWVSGTAVR